MYLTAFAATQPPDNQRYNVTVGKNDLAFAGADNNKLSLANRTADAFLCVYMKFPRSSLSCRYFFTIIIPRPHPCMGIILGYSWAGKPGDCRAFWTGGNRV